MTGKGKGEGEVSDSNSDSIANELGDSQLPT